MQTTNTDECDHGASCESFEFQMRCKSTGSPSPRHPGPRRPERRSGSNSPSERRSLGDIFNDNSLMQTRDGDPSVSQMRCHEGVILSEHDGSGDMPIRSKDAWKLTKTKTGATNFPQEIDFVRGTVHEPRHHNHHQDTRKQVLEEIESEMRAQHPATPATDTYSINTQLDDSACQYEFQRYGAPLPSSATRPHRPSPTPQAVGDKGSFQLDATNTPSSKARPQIIPKLTPVPVALESPCLGALEPSRADDARVSMSSSGVDMRPTTPRRSPPNEWPEHAKSGSTLNKLIREASEDAALILVNLPSPTDDPENAETYMSYIAAMVKGIEKKVVFVHGSGQEVWTV